MENVRVGTGVPTHAQIASMFFSNKEMQEKAAKWYIDNKGWNEGRIKHEINEFVSYWTWQKEGEKVNWQSEKGFDVCRRLGRWLWKAEQQGKARHEEMPKPTGNWFKDMMQEM